MNETATSAATAPTDQIDQVGRAALPKAGAAIERGIEAGLQPGAQLYVSLHGRPVADLAFGRARAELPMTPDSIVPWLCGGKPLTVVALLQQWEQGRLELDDLVTRYIPEFGTSGKAPITIRHLLTHLSGFPWAHKAPSVNPRRRYSVKWEDGLAEVLEASVEEGWVVGKRAGYHIFGSWFVLAEIVRRLDGRPYDRYIREEILDPLEMHDTSMGRSVEEYRAIRHRVALPHDTRTPDARTVDEATIERFAPRVDPAYGVSGPMHDLGKFYEMLLFRGQRNGVPVLSLQSVEALGAHHRAGMYDAILRGVVHWGLGVEVDSHLYPEAASRRTLGHAGWRTLAAFVDAPHGLVMAFATNGLPDETTHRVRHLEVTQAVYEDLGIAPTRPAEQPTQPI